RGEGSGGERSSHFPFRDSSPFCARHTSKKGRGLPHHETDHGPQEIFLSSIRLNNAGVSRKNSFPLAGAGRNARVRQRANKLQILTKPPIILWGTAKYFVRARSQERFCFAQSDRNGIRAVF